MATFTRTGFIFTITTQFQRRENQQAVKGIPKIKLVRIDGAARNLHHHELERIVEVMREFLSTL